MSMPRLHIDLDKITHNARTLIEDLDARGLVATGVTSAVAGSAEVAKALLRAGVSGLGDDRIENIEALRQERIAAPIMLLRPPMLSQAERVVRHADISFNSELSVVRRLSAAAQEADRVHGVVLIVDQDGRGEGILPGDLVAAAREVLRLPHVTLTGIGANPGLLPGQAADYSPMAALSALAEEVESTLDVTLELVSGGQSAGLAQALDGADIGRVNHLRLGQAILLGREPLHRQPLDDLYIDAITLVAEVIESKTKPVRSDDLQEGADAESRRLAILAVGDQDLDPQSLDAPAGLTVLEASGARLVLDCGDQVLKVGELVRFGLGERALARAMTSPFVAKTMARGQRSRQRA